MLTPQVIKVGAALLTLIIFGALLWYLYDRSAEATDPLLVRAPEQPVKVEPADRGGMEVPHQDKLVLDPAAENGAGAETLQPGPEEPMAKPEPVLAEAQSEAVPPPLPGEQATTTPPAETTETIPAQPETVAQDETTPPEAPVVTAPSAPNAKSGAYLAQMGAFSTQANATSDWQRIQKTFPTAVEGLVSDVEAASRNGRTLYLLRAGPLADRPAVDRFCNALKAKGQGCFAVAN